MPVFLFNNQIIIQMNLFVKFEHFTFRFKIAIIKIIKLLLFIKFLKLCLVLKLQPLSKLLLKIPQI